MGRISPTKCRHTYKMNPEACPFRVRPHLLMAACSRTRNLDAPFHKRVSRGFKTLPQRRASFSWCQGRTRSRWGSHSYPQHGDKEQWGRQGYGRWPYPPPELFQALPLAPPAPSRKWPSQMGFGTSRPKLCAETAFPPTIRVERMFSACLQSTALLALSPDTIAAKFSRTATHWRHKTSQTSKFTSPHWLHIESITSNHKTEYVPNTTHILQFESHFSVFHSCKTYKNERWIELMLNKP